MRKILKNENGSTLLMILIVMFALSVLGVALITMTMLGTNMKYNDTRSKKAMYYAESGLDQVYGLVAAEIDDALSYATSYTNDALEDIVDDAMDNLDDSDISNDGYVGSTQYYTVTYDAVNTDVVLEVEPIESAFDDAATAYFKAGFKDYFDNTFGIATFKSNLANIKDVTYNDGSTDHTLSIDTTSIGFNYDSTNNEYIISDIQSELTYGDDLTRKTVSADITIAVPDMDYPITLLETNSEVVDNPIWQNALVAVGDINVNAGTAATTGEVTVNGDVYAYGYELPSSTDDKKVTTNYGGLSLLSGTMNITGDVITSEHIKTVGASTNLNIEDSHVYCGSLITESTASYSTIYAKNSNVYTYDDIEMNANYSTIDIEGSYFGFSYGLDAAKDHDQSSCIIINATYGPELSITGEGTTIDYYETDADTDANKVAGIYILGTSYINVASSLGASTAYAWPYQSAESIAIKGNYYTYGNNYSLTTDDTLHELSDVGLYFAVSDSSGNAYGVSKKAEFFMANYGDISSIDNGAGIDADDVKINIPVITNEDADGDGNDDDGITIFSTGVYMDDDTSSDFIEYAGGYSSISYIIDEINDDYLFYLNTSENRESNDSGMPKSSILIDPFNPGDDSVVDSTINIVENCINTDSGAVSIDETGTDSWLKNSSQQAETIVYVNVGDSTATDYTLNANSTYDGRTQGIIITDGDVEIKGDLDFCGVIIAEGDIIIYDDGEKTFTNVEKSDADDINVVTQYLIELIASNTYLSDLFDDYYDDTYTSATTERISAQTGVSLITTDDSNLNDLYSELINIEDWEQK